MEIDLLAPFWLSFGCLVFVLLLTQFLTDSGPASSSKYQPISAVDPLSAAQDDEYTQAVADEAVEGAHTWPLSESDGGDGPIPLSRPDAQTRTRDESIPKWATPFMLNGGKEAASALWRLLSTHATRFCLASFFLKRIAFSSEGFMFQYASEKFGWQLRQTTWLRVATATSAVFITLIGGPLLGYALQKKGVRSQLVDLNMIRGSLAVLVGAFFAAWMATSGELLVLGKSSNRRSTGTNDLVSHGGMRSWGGVRACFARFHNFSDRLGGEFAGFYNDCSMRHPRRACGRSIDSFLVEHWEKTGSSL